MIDLPPKTKVFKDCTSQELNCIANICEKIPVKNGERIIEAGSAAEYFYIVNEGAVELRFSVTHYNTSKEITFERKCKGHAFGWAALAQPNTHTFSAIAVKDSELLRIKQKDMEGLCNVNNHLGYLLMKNITEIIGKRISSVQGALISEIQQRLKEKES